MTIDSAKTATITPFAVSAAESAPDPARAAAERALSLAELELANGRLAGENDALRAKCARLSATVDELLSRLADGRRRAEVRPLAGHAAVCRYCGSADMRYRKSDRMWRCHTCGRTTEFPFLCRAQAPSCRCDVARADTPGACPVHGALTPENA